MKAITNNRKVSHIILTLTLQPAQSNGKVILQANSTALWERECEWDSPLCFIVNDKPCHQNDSNNLTAFHILASPEFCTQNGNLGHIDRISGRSKNLVPRLMGNAWLRTFLQPYGTREQHLALSFLYRNTWKATGDRNILARVWILDGIYLVVGGGRRNGPNVCCSNFNLPLLQGNRGLLRNQKPAGV